MGEGMKDCTPHSDPVNYDRRVGRDGRTRAFCKKCGKFIGYVIDRLEIKQTTKEKKRGSDVE
jgi:hypothetical protein